MPPNRSVAERLRATASLREDVGADEPEPVSVVIAQHDVASVVVRLSRALEQASELLEAASELHRKVAELHGALTEPLVDLERVLAEAQKQTPNGAA